MTTTARALACLGLFALAGCRTPTPTPVPAPAPAPDPAPAADAPADSCGASQFAALVGQDKAKAPATGEGRPVRVVCSTCPMTMDYNAARLNVIFDEKTGVVQKLNCG